MDHGEVERLVRQVLDEFARSPAGVVGMRALGTGAQQACAGNDSRLNGVGPIGSIVAYGGTSAPTNWLICDGTAVSRTTYASLFAIVSTVFGVGDGATTFNLPDLRGRFPIGKAAAGTGSTLGGTGGAIDHTHAVGTLVAANESAHTHGIGSIAAATESAHTHDSGTLANANEAAHTHGPGSFSTTVTGETAETAGGNPKTVGADGAYSVTGESSVGSAHTHTLSGATAAGSAHTHTMSGSSAAGSAHTHTLSGSTASQNPPFQSVNFIIRAT